MAIIREKCYHTFTVWESEYRTDKQAVLMKLVETALSCSKRRDASG